MVVQKLSDMDEDRTVLLNYYAPLCVHYNARVAVRGTSADGNDCHVPDKMTVQHSDRQRSADSYCWYNGFIDTANKNYFRVMSTFTFGEGGVVFRSVKAKGPVYKKYDVPIERSYQTTHGWCVAVKSQSHG